MVPFVWLGWDFGVDGIGWELEADGGRGVQRVLVERATDRGQLFGRTFDRKGVVREGLPGHA